MKLLLCAMRTASLMEKVLRPLIRTLLDVAPSSIMPVAAASSGSWPRLLHRNTGKLGCFQLSVEQSIGL